MVWCRSGLWVRGVHGDELFTKQWRYLDFFCLKPWLWAFKLFHLHSMLYINVYVSSSSIRIPWRFGRMSELVLSKVIGGVFFVGRREYTTVESGTKAPQNEQLFCPWRLSSAYFFEVRHKDSLWIPHARCQNSRITAPKFNCRLVSLTKHSGWYDAR
jgi:hypothetical protein